LFHDVIYGAYVELREVAKSLNQSLLFESHREAEAVDVVRMRLLA
jgi:hypothetical protein